MIPNLSFLEILHEELTSVVKVCLVHSTRESTAYSGLQIVFLM